MYAHIFHNFNNFIVNHFGRLCCVVSRDTISHFSGIMATRTAHISSVVHLYYSASSFLVPLRIYWLELNFFTVSIL